MARPWHQLAPQLQVCFHKDFESIRTLIDHYYLVPDEIFTVDSKAPTSFDSYNPQSNEDSLSQSVTNDNSQADVIDLTEPQTDTPQFAPAIEQLPDLTVTDIDIRSEIALNQGNFP